MNHDIRRKLDRITNILWAGGVTNPVTYIEQLSYLIYLKLLEEEEADRELRALLDRAPRTVHRYEGSALTTPPLDAVRPGDRITCGIEGLGEISTSVV